MSTTGYADILTPSNLERWYWKEKMSTTDIAEKVGCSARTVSKYLDKHDIPVRDRPQAVSQAIGDGTATGYRIKENGYEQWDCDSNKVSVHRLMAVAYYGFEAVAGMDVHHINHIPWDNRPENLVLMPDDEHARYHQFVRSGRREIGEFRNIPRS